MIDKAFSPKAENFKIEGNNSELKGDVCFRKHRIFFPPQHLSFLHKLFWIDFQLCWELKPVNLNTPNHQSCSQKRAKVASVLLHLSVSPHAISSLRPEFFCWGYCWHRAPSWKAEIMCVIAVVCQILWFQTLPLPFLFSVEQVPKSF